MACGGGRSLDKGGRNCWVLLRDGVMGIKPPERCLHGYLKAGSQHRALASTKLPTSLILAVWGHWGVR